VRFRALRCFVCPASSPQHAVRGPGRSSNTSRNPAATRSPSGLFPSPLQGLVDLGAYRENFGSYAPCSDTQAFRIRYRSSLRAFIAAFAYLFTRLK
jgi:hypothetical protein